MRFACPHCNAHLQSEPHLAGKTIKCPACAGKLAIPEGGDSEEQTGTQNVGARSSEEALPEEGAELNAAQAQWVDFSNVPLWQSSLVGLAIAFVWLLAIYILPEGSYLRVLFFERTWVQFVTTGLTGWSVAILVLKSLKMRRQRAAMMLEILPTDISEEINPGNVPQFYEHVQAMPERVRNSFMVQRVRRGLEYFWVRRNNPEVASMMSSQSDIDANSIGGSYSMVKVFVWAIPIMGFIGTVLGIGAAIGSFDQALSAGEDMDVLMDSLGKVTGGLGTAFDTTLLALVLSLLVSVPASAMQKSEEDLLNQVDDYCNENLLKRLNDGGAGSTATDSGLVQQIGEAIARNQREMVDKFREIHENTAKGQEAQIEAFKKASEVLEKQLEDMGERAKRYDSEIEKVQENAAKSLETLGEGLKGLNSVLKDLGEKQIVVKKKGWFG